MLMNPAQIALSMLFAILIAEQGGHTLVPQAPVITTRDEIKAARKKFEREIQADKTRPWDGMDLTGPHALERRPTPDGK